MNRTYFSSARSATLGAYKAGRDALRRLGEGLESATYAGLVLGSPLMPITEQVYETQKRIAATLPLPLLAAGITIVAPIVAVLYSLMLRRDERWRRAMARHGEAVMTETIRTMNEVYAKIIEPLERDLEAAIEAHREVEIEGDVIEMSRLVTQHPSIRTEVRGRITYERQGPDKTRTRIRYDGPDDGRTIGVLLTEDSAKRLLNAAIRYADRGIANDVTFRVPLSSVQFNLSYPFDNNPMVEQAVRRVNLGDRIRASVRASLDPKTNLRPASLPEIVQTAEISETL